MLACEAKKQYVFFSTDYFSCFYCVTCYSLHKCIQKWHGDALVVWFYSKEVLFYFSRIYVEKKRAWRGGGGEGDDDKKKDIIALKYYLRWKSGWHFVPRNSFIWNTHGDLEYEISFEMFFFLFFIIEYWIHIFAITISCSWRVDSHVWIVYVFVCHHNFLFVFSNRLSILYTI